jgi:hypothetical protein
MELLEGLFLLLIVILVFLALELPSFISRKTKHSQSNYPEKEKGMKIGNAVLGLFGAFIGMCFAPWFKDLGLFYKGPNHMKPWPPNPSREPHLMHEGKYVPVSEIPANRVTYLKP